MGPAHPTYGQEPRGGLGCGGMSTGLRAWKVVSCITDYTQATTSGEGVGRRRVKELDGVKEGWVMVMLRRLGF
ncbi:hypothetical protein ACLB2K_030300 [Fragaria x ananassa]